MTVFAVFHWHWCAEGWLIRMHLSTGIQNSTRTEIFVHFLEVLWKKNKVLARIFHTSLETQVQNSSEFLIGLTPFHINHVYFKFLTNHTIKHHTRKKFCPDDVLRTSCTTPKTRAERKEWYHSFLSALREKHISLSLQSIYLPLENTEGTTKVKQQQWKKVRIALVTSN